jgi:hypothetical protein
MTPKVKLILRAAAASYEARERGQGSIPHPAARQTQPGFAPARAT